MNLRRWCIRRLGDLLMLASYRIANAAHKLHWKAWDMRPKIAPKQAGGIIRTSMNAWLKNIYGVKRKAGK